MLRSALEAVPVSQSWGTAIDLMKFMCQNVFWYIGSVVGGVGGNEDFSLPWNFQKHILKAVLRFLQMQPTEIVSRDRNSTNRACSNFSTLLANVNATN